MIEIRDLRVDLDVDAGILRAIDGLRLTIERGETFALVGESGCGKSMTALALMRLLPENGGVTAGDLHLRGDRRTAATEAPVASARAETDIDLLELPESAMRRVRGRRIGMIFQEPATSLNPVMRVGEQIVEVIEAHTALRGTEARAKAVQWLQRVGIPEPERRIDEYPFRMSGGQKQRVMIAVALAAEPEFLIADEPTTALDVTIQAQILDLLKDLQRERHGLLLITHDLAVVAGMAHRVALMYAGQVVELAPAAEFFAQPRHPYAQALLRALPSAAQRSGALEAIAGTVPPLTQVFVGCRFAPRCGFALPACREGVIALEAAAPQHDVRCIRAAELAQVMRPLAQASQAEVQLQERTAAARAPAPAPKLPHNSPVMPAPRAPDRAAAAIDAAAASATAVPLLQLRDLWVRFPIRRGVLQRVRGHFDAVRGVSFELQRGETLALVGESGCGKTTTGKAIVQLLRGTATVQGEALLGGVNLFALQGETLRQARRRVQIIFQDPFASLDPRMRVAEVLEEGMRALQPQTGADERRMRIARLVEQVGLRADALQRYPHEFSGGQRQRIAIARALAVEPELIICDEPTSALDVSVQAQILNLMRELQRELGLAYLFITHNIGVVSYLADRVAVMKAGRIEELGSAAEVLEAPQAAYTRELLAAVPRLAIEQ